MLVCNPLTSYSSSSVQMDKESSMELKILFVVTACLPLLEVG